MRPALMRKCRIKMCHNRKNRWIRRILLIILLVLMIAAGALGIYVSQYYHADNTALQPLESTASVTVTETADYFLFDGQGMVRHISFIPERK